MLILLENRRLLFGGGGWLFFVFVQSLAIRTQEFDGGTSSQREHGASRSGTRM